jgi:hypothetical protein
MSVVDFETFLKVLNRPDGWKPAGTAGKSSVGARVKTNTPRRIHQRIPSIRQGRKWIHRSRRITLCPHSIRRKNDG